MKNELIHLVTRWDEKQSKTKHYNPHALGIYFHAVDSTMELVEGGSTLGDALSSCFNDRLLAFLEKGMAKHL